MLQSIIVRIVIVASVTFLAIACVPEQEEITFDPSASLRFSSDTVLFDTVFTSVGSITKRLRVYNDAERAVQISAINLGEGSDSPYMVAINGVFRERFEDVTLLGNDSLLVLVEVTIDPRDENLPFLVSDRLTFLTNGNEQEVSLVSYGQDAIFLNGEVLACDDVWTADKPYVIYNSVLVDSLCHLTIEAGARIYSRVNSYIFVEGTLIAEGTAENRILFRNDRLDAAFENAPGQWGGIVFLPGSKGNILENVTIRNARTGVYLGTPDNDDEPDLILGNARIENMGGDETVPAGDFNVLPGFGFLALTSDARVYNTLITNCQVNTVGNYAGGNYTYEHCTFSAFSFDFFRQSASLVFSNNLVLADESVITAPLNVRVVNSILWGSLPDELLLSEDPSSPFSVSVSHSVLRTRQYADAPFLTNCLINQDPLFAEPEEYDYHLLEDSPAINLGTPVGVDSDLDGNPRNETPDAGAYEFQL